MAKTISEIIDEADCFLKLNTKLDAKTRFEFISQLIQSILLHVYDTDKNTKELRK